MSKLRLELKFLLKQKCIPLDYRSVILSFIKSVLEKKYPETYNELYLANRMKTYSFSVFLPVDKIEGDRFLLKENAISVKFSCADTKMLMKLYNSFLSMKNSEYEGCDEYPLPGSNSMKLVGVNYSNTKPIFGNTNKVVIKFLSPLVVRKNLEGGKNFYLNYYDDGFAKTLQFVVSNYLKIRNIPDGKVALRPIKPVPVTGKRLVIKYKDMNIDCSAGVFELEASPQIIEEAYMAGMGSRRSEGFGLFDIISAKEADA
ncbi:MAG: CRISPR-associated endoribonuclease Cas6 [Christensenellaceae bacterium]|jgi:CRISPR-associated endoribonuclease Cas6|nr:CRISPR-associated endoribonuclease Cas6 [Christensenellaceae bacterium]